MGNHASGVICENRGGIIMLYKNIKTGAVINVNSIISGENWQEVKSASKPRKSPVKGSENKSVRK